MLTWLENTPLGLWIDTSPWAYPFLLTAHGLGMAVVVGLSAVLSVRVLGFPAGAPLGAYRGLQPYLWIAFLVNAASGVALFVADAAALAFNPSFQVKMAAIVAGVIVLQRLFAVAVIPAAARTASLNGGAATVAESWTDAPLPRSARPLAIATLLIWWLAENESGRLVA